MITTAVVRGAGSIGARHLRVLRSVGVEELVAVPVRAGRSSSSELGDARVADAIPSDADLVVIATDTARHVDDTIQALDSGARLVLVEKPLAPSTTAIGALEAHPRSDRVRVCAPLRFHEGLRAARAEMARLRGDDSFAPRSARIVSQSWLPDWRPGRDYRESYSARRAEGGVLLDLVHEIDYALWTFGAPAGRILTALSPLPSPVLGLPVDEAADLMWSSADGTQVSMRLDYVTRPTERSLHVTSAFGSVHWDAVTSRVQTVSADGATETSDYPLDLDRDAVLARQARALSVVLDGGGEDGLLDLATARLAVELTERVRAMGWRELDEDDFGR